MSLVSPWLLLLLLLGIPVVLAFLRRPPPRRRVVSSVLLLRAIASRPARRQRPPWRELVSLALMLLALLALVAGLSTRPDPPPRGLVVVMDSSAAAAQRRSADLAALDAALQQQAGGAVTLVSTAPPRVVVQSALDHSALREAAAALPADGTDGDLTALLVALCRGARPPKLLALLDTPTPTDLDGLRCPASAPARGDGAANHGIVSLSARRVDGLGLVEAQITADAPGGAAATLHAGGAEVGRVTLDADTLVRLDLPDATELSVTLDDGGRWDADDTATVAIPPAPTVRGLLVTEAPRGFAAAVLSAHPGVRLTVAAPDAVPEDGSPWDLLVVEADLDRLPAARRVVVLGADPSPTGTRWGRSVRRPTVEVEQQRAPLLQYVDVEQLYVGKARTLVPPAGATVLLTSPAGPLAVQAPTPDGEALVVGFPLDDTDLVLRAGFVNLIANAVEWARPAPVSSATGIGVLSAAETAAAPLAARDAPADPRPPYTAALAALLALVLLGAEWILQWVWRPAA